MPGLTVLLADAARPLNWSAGWVLVLLGLSTGAGVGLFFHREDFWGGYASFRRRIFRLGHIALVQLGVLNLLFALSPWPDKATWAAQVASVCFVIGGITMPTVCFLSAWRKPMRLLFPIPVIALVAAVVLTLV